MIKSYVKNEKIKNQGFFFFGESYSAVTKRLFLRPFLYGRFICFGSAAVRNGTIGIRSFF